LGREFKLLSDRRIVEGGGTAVLDHSHREVADLLRPEDLSNAVFGFLPKLVAQCRLFGTDGVTLFFRLGCPKPFKKLVGTLSLGTRLRSQFVKSRGLLGGQSDFQSHLVARQQAQETAPIASALGRDLTGREKPRARKGNDEEQRKAICPRHEPPAV